MAHVVETMRPLPAERLPGMPELLLGLSIVRGAVVPVVDLAGFFGDRDGVVSRYVLVRAGARRLVLAVSAVRGVVRLDPASGGGEVIAGEAAARCIRAVMVEGGRSLVVLDVGRLLPEAILRAIDREGASHE
ncbi:Hypothetical protein A7982_11095 [Minicystis rosea]|nr:Hypothetical protein A7982_11095 [Minicystis rosea]